MVKQNLHKESGAWFWFLHQQEHHSDLYDVDKCVLGALHAKSKSQVSCMYKIKGVYTMKSGDLMVCEFHDCRVDSAI